LKSHFYVIKVIHYFIYQMFNKSLEFFQPADKSKYVYGGLSYGRPVTPPKGKGSDKQTNKT